MNQTAEAVNEVEVKESRKSTFMQRVWAKMGKEEKGFTLIELLAVLIIIAIIAVIAIPLIGGIINKSKDSADVSTASQVYNAARLYVVGEKNGDFKTAGSVKASDLITAGYLEAKTVLPSTKNALDGTNTVVTFSTSGELTNVVLADGAAEANKHTFSGDEVLQAEKAKATEKVEEKK